MTKLAMTRLLLILKSSLSDTKIEFEPPPTGLTHTWMLDSPLDATQGDPTTRLESLADAIEPIADKIVTLDDRFRRFFDIVYHVTPQHVGGISGEFDWFRCPADLMRRISGWNLDVSYEMFWFDHPDWERLKPATYRCTQIAMVSRAIDKVRAAEVKQLKADGVEPILKRGRWLLLKEASGFGVG